jgi:hypothetical protein
MLHIMKLRNCISGARGYAVKADNCTVCLEYPKYYGTRKPITVHTKCANEHYPVPHKRAHFLKIYFNIILIFTPR